MEELENDADFYILAPSSTCLRISRSHQAYRNALPTVVAHGTNSSLIEVKLMKPGGNNVRLRSRQFARNDSEKAPRETPPDANAAATRQGSQRVDCMERREHECVGSD